MVSRSKLTALALACGALFNPTPAKADPGTVAVALTAIMSVETAVAITTALYTYGAYALTGYAIYGSISARNAAKRQAAAARAAYNAGLQDRSITALTGSPGRRIVYGRCDTGGDLVAMFTTDKTAHGLGFFRAFDATKPDAFKHLIVVWAAHQCQAIHELKIDGIPVGALDENGWATGNEWKKSDPKPTAYGQLPGHQRTIALPGNSTILSVVLIAGTEGRTHTPVGNGAGGWSFVGGTLTLPDTVTVGGFPYHPVPGDTWDIAYSGDDIDGTSTVRVRHHLGSPDQAADAELMALLPDKWTADHRLRGRCYSWITLDLERAQFQGGPPGLTVDISGALVLDPRTGLRVWSDNSALCANDYLLRVEGMNVTAAEVDTDSVIAAANDCDVPIDFTIGTTTVTGPRYTCNGVFVPGPAKEPVLIDICESMAGFHTYSGTWRVLAGSWTPPVMDLTDKDLFGSIHIVQAGEPSGALFNSARGQYVPSGSSVPADIETYSNAVFVAADRKPLFTDLELPFTNSRARAKNISRIKVEQSRAGEVIFFPAKLRAWPLQTGDRVRVKSAEYGFNFKAYRVTDWQFGLGSPVGLTLQEDGPDLYDGADAAVPDPTPNTDLPNPWFVEPLAAVNADSGTAQLQKLGDGTIISRVLVSWPRSTAAYMDGGRVEIAWREAGATVMHLVSAGGLDTQAHLTGVRDGGGIVIELTAINTQGQRSATISKFHLVQGKSLAPAQVQGLALQVLPGALRGSRTPSTELDYDYTIYRHGASFAAGTQVPGTSDKRGFVWPWPAPGDYTIWAADVDTTGHIGDAVSKAVTISQAALSPANGSLGIKLNVGDFAGTVNYSEAYIHGRDGSGAPIDAPGSIMVNGVATPVPNGSLFTNMGPVAGYIVWDSAGATFPKLGGAYMQPYALARRWQGQWQYDDNSTGWVNFTPLTTHWLIGTLESGAPDTNSPPGLIAASLLAAATTLNATTEAASEAYAAASAAATLAHAAQDELAIIRSDGYLSAGEKPAVIQRWYELYNAQASNVAQANALGIVTERNDYTAAIAALGTYLNSLAPSWSDTTVNTPITPAVDNTKWQTAYLALQVLMLKIADESSRRANWNQIAGVANFRVVARGANAAGVPTSPGLYLQGSLVVGEARSYVLAIIRRSDGAIISSSSFDVYGDPAQAAAMAAALNAVSSAYVVVVYSYDEPQTSRLSNGLPAAMYRCGASRTVFGSAQFKVRSAYVLVGIPGCGEGNGAEAYQGAVDYDTAAWVDVAFQVIAGNLVGVTANYSPTSLKDYGYTGTLDATSDLALINRGGMTVEGNAATKNDTAGNAWDSSVTSRDGYAGGAYMAFTPAQADKHLMVGLNVDPATDNDYASLDVEWYCQGDGSLQARRQGDVVVWGGAYAAGDLLSITYDGSTVRWLKNGVLITSWAAAITAPLFLDSSFYSVGAKVTGLRFGPLSSNAWAAIGGNGKPADNATKNEVFNQVSDPGAVADGSIWITGGIAKQRSGGAWVPYVGPLSISTLELAAQAATEIYVASASNVSVDEVTGVPTGFFTDVVSVSFTPSVSGEVLLLVDGSATITTPASGDFAAKYASLSTRLTVNGVASGPNRTYARDDDVGYGVSVGATIVRSRRVAVTAGTAYTFLLQAQKVSYDTTTTIGAIQLRAEFVKK